MKTSRAGSISTTVSCCISVVIYIFLAFNVSRTSCHTISTNMSPKLLHEKFSSFSWAENKIPQKKISKLTLFMKNTFTGTRIQTGIWKSITIYGTDHLYKYMVKVYLYIYCIYKINLFLSYVQPGQSFTTSCKAIFLKIPKFSTCKLTA